MQDDCDCLTCQYRYLADEQRKLIEKLEAENEFLKQELAEKK